MLRLVPTISALLLAAFLVGCKGFPVPGEKQARERVKTVSASYRPDGRKPALPVLTTNASLGDFLTYGMLNNPEVETAYYEWLASVERITEQRSLPDPQLTFQMDIENIVTSIMPGLMMNFPGAGKLRAAGAVASAQSEANYFAFRAAALKSAYDVKRAYYQLYFLEEKIRVNQKTLGLLGQLEELARAQNAVGKVTLQDVLRAQIEQDRLRTEIENLTDSRSSLLSQFKAALGMQAKDPPPPLPSNFESTALNLSPDQILDTAFARSLRLKSLESEVRAAEASITLAYKARMPDSSVGLMADVKMSPTVYRPVGAVTIPLWRDKLAAQVAQAQAGKRAAQGRLSTEQINLAVELAERSFVLRQAARNVQLLRNQLLPKARQSLEVARSSYLGSQTDFLNLIDAERTLLGFELDQVEASTQRELALAELSLLAQGGSPGVVAPAASTISMPRVGGGMGPSMPLGSGAPMRAKSRNQGEMKGGQGPAPQGGMNGMP